MSDFVFKVSEEGYDVENATPEQCVFDSNYPPLKIIAQGELVVDFDEWIFFGATEFEAQLAQVRHGLGYLPIFQAYCYNATTGTQSELPLVYTVTINKNVTMKVSATVDSEYIYFTYYRKAVSGSADLTGVFRIKYYVFAEKAA